MKRIIVALAVFAFGSGFALAQDNASEDVQCTTVVIKSLRIEKNQDLDFGTVAQGVGEVEIKTDQERAVKLTITGQERYDVIVSYKGPNALETAQGARLPFKYDVDANSVDNPKGAGEIKSGDSVALNEKGNHFLFLGGTIDVAADQTPGFYTGTVSFNVEYDL